MRSTLFFVSCLNCKYFEPSPYDDKYNDLALCHQHVRLIDDKYHFEKAEHMRRKEDKCGINGKDFELLESSNSKKIIV
jgi:hypothetical protein